MKTETKQTFTPGPWEYAGKGSAIEVCVEGTYQTVAYAHEELENYQANAQLIAAAPDLLEALKMAYKGLKDPNTRRTLNGKGMTQVITEAIAKAEGR